MKINPENIIDSTETCTQQLVERDGKHYLLTTLHDDAALENIKKLRDAKLTTKQEFPLHDKADLRTHIQFPSMEHYTLFRRKFPDIDAMMSDTDQTIRNFGFRTFVKMFPEYVVQNRL